MSLKVVKFDTKMYLNLKKKKKRGQVSDGGDWQNFRRIGGPPAPQEKNPEPYFLKMEVIEQ